MNSSLLFARFSGHFLPENHQAGKTPICRLPLSDETVDLLNRDCVLEDKDENIRLCFPYEAEDVDEEPERKKMVILEFSRTSQSWEKKEILVDQPMDSEEVTKLNLKIVFHTGDR